MLNHPTHQQLSQLRLFGMATALEEQSHLPDLERMTFEERLGLLVEREISARASKQMAGRLRRAKLKHAATPEDVDYRAVRGLDRTLFNRLLTGDWVTQHQNVLITGPTGVGKTWLACALANHACRQGHSSLYLRAPRMIEELTIAHGDGRYVKFMAQLAKVDVLLLDDWGLAALTDSARRDLLEIVDDRHEARSTIVTSQLPLAHWHDAIGDSTLADAILDRLVHNAHQIALDGESMRKRKTSLTKRSVQE
ncbi:MAG: AAA family ATPase [Gallionellales bacterium CG_4_9_14_0_8_um_filter_59_50]|nr:MAG: AAA family ATPase [Gallionellales bacterium CG_4_9_14_0_8_um_filter_59_50]